MPVIDLRAILTPIVESVATLLFPDVVQVQAPIETQDSVGDTIRTWQTIIGETPALITYAKDPGPVAEAVPVNNRSITVLLAGDWTGGNVVIGPECRVVVQVNGNWDGYYDVLSVFHDEARVTTTISARYVDPGTPYEPDAEAP